jgi:hypothetical protein
MLALPALSSNFRRPGPLHLPEAQEASPPPVAWRPVWPALALQMLPLRALVSKLRRLGPLHSIAALALRLAQARRHR